MILSLFDKDLNNLNNLSRYITQNVTEMVLRCLLLVVLQMNGPMGDTSSANNTAESSVNGAKPWEHAWTVEEMRNTASNWHLANDVGVSCLLLMSIVE